MTGNREVWRDRLMVALAAFYGIAGVLHLAIPKPFLSITPECVPYPQTVIMLTGTSEIAGAAGLMVPRLRRMAGIALALYAICVFPANIKHAIDGLGGLDASVWQWLYHLLRLPLQPVIIWVALFAGGTVAWPWLKGGEKADP